MTTEAPTSLASGFAPAAVTPDAVYDLAVAASSGLRLDRAKIEVLRRTICAKLSDDQLLLYLARCDLAGINPFSMAYAFPERDGGLAMGLRIDGMRALALRTGELESRTVETLLVPEGENKGKLMGARATVKRTNIAPITEDAYMAEYAGRPGAGFGWTQFPETMIRKVAESKALRAAFADVLAGLFEPAEMAEGK